jgi:hypothetical protein
MLVRVDPVAVRTVVFPVVVPIKPLQVLHHTVQRLRPMAQQAACQRSAILAVAVAVAALPRLVARVLATEVLAQAVELAEKVAKELPTQCELILQLCTALAEAARADG